MNFHLKLRARIDLVNIWDYTASEWSNKQANKYTSEINKAFEYLSKHPRIGVPKPWIKNELRSYQCNSHLIYYYIVSEDLIKISRILHEKYDVLSEEEL